MIRMKYRFLAIIMLLTSAMVLNAQEKLKVYHLPYYDMDSWLQRDIKESKLIGGETKTLYEVGKTGQTNKAEAWDHGDSPWETSSIYANVMGISKVSSTVFPEKRGNGYCARLETVLEEVYVLGFIHVTALATGSLFLGKLFEPIKNVNSPMTKMSQGVPCDKKVKAIRFDYKAKTGGKRIKASALNKSDVEGPNAAEVCVFLQRRWEDEKGNIQSVRVGTAYMRITKSTDWVNGYVLKLNYGDISKEPYFRDYMGLNYSGYELYALNSKGQNVKINEVGWDAKAEPTHIIIRFAAGFGGAYVGAIGDCLWVDNVELLVEE